jgi:hypothetical protein
MKPLLAIGLAALFAGCGTQYDWEVDHQTGQVYLAGTRPAFNSEAAQQIAQGAANDVGRLAQGYWQAAAQYQAAHPVVTVIQAPAVQQHGSGTVWVDGQPIWVNY